jgi:hypothetical protein
MTKDNNNQRIIAIRKAAMKKIKYADKKKNIGDAFSNNKNFVRKLIKDSHFINKSTCDDK